MVGIQLFAAELKRNVVCAYAAAARQLAGLAEVGVDRVERERVGDGADLCRERRQWNPSGVDGARHSVDHVHIAAQLAVRGGCC